MLQTCAPPSSLYTMLPKAVRSRIPVLTSLRRTASSTMFGRSALRRSSSTTIDGSRDDAQSSSTASMSSTPRSGSPESTELVQRAIAPDLGLEPAHLRSGVNWDLATHGCRTWLSARSMAQHPNADPAQLRALHIDAVRYMTMSLPKDLTPQEAHMLRQHIPQDVLDPPDQVGPDAGQRSTNTLRSSVGYVTCCIMAIVFFFLPLLMTGITTALIFERQHHITERVLTNSLDLGTVLSERGAELQRALQRFRGGPVGGVLSWVAEGVVGGLVDGVRNAQISRSGEPR